ncbi:MAG TPA: hypothetical protein VGB32_10605 [Candidatus Bathyarchaeia archaeon]
MKQLKEEDRYEIAPGVFRDYVKSHPAYRSKWRKARKQVLKRDNHTCLLCGITQEKLLENPTGVRPKDYLNVCHLGEKENLELGMLATLCWNCHKKIDGKISEKNEQGKTIGYIHDKKLSEEYTAKLKQILNKKGLFL